MAEAISGHEYLMKLKVQGDYSHQSFETLFRHLDHKARQNGTPISGQLELTPLCNFDCKMCYYTFD